MNFPIHIDRTIGLDKQSFERKIVNIFLPVSFNICFWCSKEPSQRDGSFEYPQHMFWLKKKENDFFWYTLLTKVLQDDFIFQLYSNFDRTSCKQIVEALIRRLIRRQIWVSTVLLCSTEGRYIGLYT